MSTRWRQRRSDIEAPSTPQPQPLTPTPPTLVGSTSVNRSRPWPIHAQRARPSVDMNWLWSDLLTGVVLTSVGVLGVKGCGEGVVWMGEPLWTSDSVKRKVTNRCSQGPGAPFGGSGGRSRPGCRRVLGAQPARPCPSRKVFKFARAFLGP